MPATSTSRAVWVEHTASFIYACVCAKPIYANLSRANILATDVRLEAVLLRV
jgi:hypothetical protein